MDVDIHLLDQARPIRRGAVENTYTKGGMFAVMFLDGSVEKYPLCRIFRVSERLEAGL